MSATPSPFECLVAPPAPSLSAELAAETVWRAGALVRRVRNVLPRIPAWERLEEMLPADVVGRAGDPFRCWLSAAEEAVGLAEAAIETAKGGASARSRLVEFTLEAGALADLAPRGSIPADFARRCTVHARRRLGRLAVEGPLLLAPWLRAPRTRVRIPFAEDPDLGRPEDELEIPEAGIRFRRGPRGGALHLDLPSETPPLPREVRSPSVGAALRAVGVHIRVGPRDPAFELRVDRAMAFLDRVWPGGADTVRGFAWRVVPVTDRGTVSYSSARRPGILYIHAKSRPVVRLAEDLLHETVHVRIHSLERLASLTVRLGPDGEETRFWSPWRREWRPVRGLLHGACTFAAGAEFFERVLRASEEGSVRVPSSRRLWLARRLLEERENVGIALRALEIARRRGLLTPAARRLVEAARASRSSLSTAVSRRRGELSRTVKGREELERLSRWRESLRSRPLRWGW